MHARAYIFTQTPSLMVHIDSKTTEHVRQQPRWFIMALPLFAPTPMSHVFSQRS